MEKNTLTIFCANCQKETNHEASVDVNGEFVFYCLEDGCDRFIKLPSTITEEEFDAFMAAHKLSNEGQISLEKAEGELRKLLNRSQPEVEVETTVTNEGIQTAAIE